MLTVSGPRYSDIMQQKSGRRPKKTRPKLTDGMRFCEGVGEEKPPWRLVATAREARGVQGKHPLVTVWPKRYPVDPG